MCHIAKLRGSSKEAFMLQGAGALFLVVTAAELCFPISEAEQVAAEASQQEGGWEVQGASPPSRRVPRALPSSHPQEGVLSLSRSSIPRSGLGKEGAEEASRELHKLFYFKLSQLQNCSM